mmetsp:Transcript_16269/g.18390  ORF Transcript_16269/g.18390 Transcript_16269/m.18390 type:complete len:286 (+) Transcript_16269:57-914(+)
MAHSGNVNGNGSVAFILDSYSDSNLKLVWEKDPVLKFILRTVPHSVSYIKQIVEHGDGSKELYQELRRITATRMNNKQNEERIPEALQRLLNCNQQQLLGSLIYSRYNKLGKLASLNAQLLMQQNSKQSQNAHENCTMRESVNARCCNNVNVNQYMNSVSNSWPSSSGGKGNSHRFNIDRNLNTNMINTLNAKKKTNTSSKMENKKCHKCSNDAVVSAFDPLCDKTNRIDTSNSRAVCNCNCVSRLNFRVANKRLVLSSLKQCGSNPDLIWFSPARTHGKSKSSR